MLFSHFLSYITILLFSKNALESILVRRFFSHFSVLLRNTNNINIFMNLYESNNKSQITILKFKHKLNRVTNQNVLKMILKRLNCINNINNVRTNSKTENYKKLIKFI